MPENKKYNIPQCRLDNPYYNSGFATDIMPWLAEQSTEYERACPQLTCSCVNGSFAVHTADLIGIYAICTRCHARIILHEYNSDK